MRTSINSAGGSVTGSAREPSLTITTVTGVPAARLRMMATAQPSVSSSGCGATTRHDLVVMDEVISMPRRVQARRHSDRAGTITRSRTVSGSPGITHRTAFATFIPSTSRTAANTGQRTRSEIDAVAALTVATTTDIPPSGGVPAGPRHVRPRDADGRRAALRRARPPREAWRNDKVRPRADTTHPEWSGRRESNPRCKLGKLVFCL